MFHVGIHSFSSFLRGDQVNNYKLIAVQFLEIVSNMYIEQWRNKECHLFEAPLSRGFHEFPCEA